MRKFLMAVTLSTFGLGNPVAADQSVVVVELYTSQGCSSCPPADEILAEVASQENVIALALHVDYWDYIGWPDTLAQAEFSDQQLRQNKIMNSRYRLVTPQMIFNGLQSVAGANRSATLKHIKKLAKNPVRADLSVQRTGNDLRISVKPLAGKLPPADVHVVQYTPSTIVDIKRGENRGRKINYVNTVTKWETVGNWNGKAAMSIEHKVSGDGEYVVIVKSRKLGQMLAASRLE